MGREDQGLESSHGRYQVVPRTLIFITSGEDVLLLRAGAGKGAWAGRYNGIGGHLEPGEDIYAAALREIREESGLRVQDLRLRAVVHVDVDDPIRGVLLFVFTAVAADRALLSSPEGGLNWFDRGNLPDEGLFEDLTTLLPRLLGADPDDPPIFALYRYDPDDRLVVTFSSEA